MQVQQPKSFAPDGPSLVPSTHSPETTMVKGHPLRSRMYGPRWLPSVARCLEYATACCHTTTPCSTKPAVPLTPWTIPPRPFLNLSSLSSPRTVTHTALTGSSWLISPVLELGESNIFHNHVTIMWQSCDNRGSHVTIMWQSCGSHVTVMWQSCDNHVTVMWQSWQEPYFHS